MYLSLNWVKKWLKLPKLEAKQLALDLTMSTVEVEGVGEQSKLLDGIVVGRVEEITKHPQADRLHVCQVNLGKTTEQIVCGGENLSKGMLVAVATVGTRVRWHGTEDMTLTKTKIRGVESNGMIVSATEVGLENLFPQKNEREIIDLSSFRIKVGASLAQELGLDDTIVDIDNKSINHRPDLWGQYGLARELAAIYKVKLKDYKIEQFKAGSKASLTVNIRDKRNCFRYLALAISNVEVKESPWWLKKSLVSVGIRPVNNIVDVTNYVMYELGQPMHAFDRAHIDDNQIIIRPAKKGEKFTTLDGAKHSLSETMLLIADSKKPIAIAGIMGGQNSEIGNDTTEIVLESANFKASSIRRTSTALGLRTDASARFEKSLDPVLAEVAIKRAAELILAMCPSAHISSKLVDENHNPFQAINIQVSEQLINDRFGLVIPTKEIKDILQRLQFGVKYKARVFNISVPSWRATKDISIAEDIVEEVARIHGYDNIDPKLPRIELENPEYNVPVAEERDIKLWLAFAQGYDEIYTYPFTDQDWMTKLSLSPSDHVRVKNAVSPDMSLLNLSLLPNLLSKAEDNMRWFDEFKFFELERVFEKKEKSHYHTDASKKKFLPRQNKHLAGVEVSKDNEDRLFLKIKGLLESMMDYWKIDWQIESVALPYASTSYIVKYQDIVLGKFGILNKDIFDSRGVKVNIGFWEINFRQTVRYINQSLSYKPVPKFPSVERDIALMIKADVLWKDIEAEIEKISPLIRQIEPFDLFMGKGIPDGKKSLAFHLEFRADDRTLQADDVDDLEKKIMQSLEKKFGAKRR